MAKNDSVEFFLRFLNERYENFKTKLTALLQAITLEDRGKKGQAAQAVLVALDDLKRAMSPTDHPKWVGPFEERLRWYIAEHTSNAQAGLIIIQSLLGYYPLIANQKWSFEDDQGKLGIDFGAIYAEYYSTSRLPDLFNQLVGHLRTIVESGQIDSIQTISALENLIATVRKCTRGDYFSTRGAWEFSRVFLRKFIVNVLEGIPAIKPAVKAVRETMSELEIEWADVHKRVKQKLFEMMSEELPMLEYTPLGLPPPDDTASDNGGTEAADKGGGRR